MLGEQYKVTNFQNLKDQIAFLGRAEYQYDRLVSDFAEHYLELIRAEYKTLPDIQIFQIWLKHLQKEIRPSLLNAWTSMAEHYGFKLGDKIVVGTQELYAVRASCYPLENIVRFTGFNVKKDGKPGQSAIDVSLNEDTKVRNGDVSLDSELLSTLFFEGTSRLPDVKQFLRDEIAKLEK